MRSHHLRIEPRRVARLQMFDEKKQSQLGSVGNGMKHTFAAENAARVNAVKSADDFARFVPNFDAVRRAKLVQIKVSLDKFFDYPRSAAIAAFGAGATFDDGAEIFINRKCELRFLLFLSQTFRNVKLGKFQNGAFARTKPGQRKTVNVPRENALPVSISQIFQR